MCVKYSSVVLDSCVTEDSGTSLAHGCSDYRLYRGGRSCVPSLGWSVTTRGSQAVEQQPDPAAAWAAASRAMWNTGGASAAFQHRAAPARPHRTEPRYWFLANATMAWIHAAALDTGSDMSMLLAACEQAERTAALEDESHEHVGAIVGTTGNPDKPVALRLSLSRAGRLLSLCDRTRCDVCHDCSDLDSHLDTASTATACPFLPRTS